MLTYTFCLLYLLDVSMSFSPNKTKLMSKEHLIERVVNGWAADLGDVPYQVAFKSSIGRPKQKYWTYCGGVIIAPSKLLSAAHCFVDKPSVMDQICGIAGHVKQRMLSGTFAVAGQLSNKAIYDFYDSRENGQWRRLKSVRYPPKYKFPKLDIAIVFLRMPFNFDSTVNFIPYASKLVDYDGKCLVSGFGRISHTHNSDKLLLAHLNLIPMRLCSRMHRRNMRHFVCTSSQLTDVGKGDSGGPLVCTGTGDPNESNNGVLVGIVSGHAYGVGSFFTRVSSYNRFIENNKSTKHKVHPILYFMLNLIQWTFLLF